jgi:hypothetical protein
MTSENVQGLDELDAPRPSMWRLALAAGFLIVTTTVFVRVSASYNYHLVRTGQIRSSEILEGYSGLYDPLFSAIQFLAVSLFLCFRSLLPLRAWVGRVGQPWYGSVGKGLLVGLAIFLCAVPTFLMAEFGDPLPQFFVNHHSDGSGVACCGAASASRV